MTGKCCKTQVPLMTFNTHLIPNDRQLALFCANLIVLSKKCKKHAKNDMGNIIASKVYFEEAKSLWECNLKSKGFKWIDIKHGVSKPE